MSAMQPEIANDPGQVLFLDDMVGIGGPKALPVEFLERPARKFEPTLADFWNCLRRGHGNEISPPAICKQAASSQPQFPKPAVHFLEMEIQ